MFIYFTTKGCEKAHFVFSQPLVTPLGVTLIYSKREDCEEKTPHSPIFTDRFFEMYVYTINHIPYYTDYP